MIVGLYLILPLLRLWIKKDNKKYVEYFILLSLVFTFLIPQIIDIGSNYSTLFQNLDEIMKKINLQYVGGYTTYFILGWYIHNFDVKNKKIVYTLGIVSLIITIFSTYILSKTTDRAVQMYGDLTLNVFFQSKMIFLFIKTKYINKEEKENKFINNTSQHSLGIYAMHALVITIMYKIMSKIGFDLAIINIPIIVVISFAISFLTTYILSKIPILKEMVL